VWYRKDSATTFGIGIRQADGEEVAQYVDNFALFNAPPGTVQLSLSDRRTSNTSPAALLTTTLTDGTRLFASGADGSS